MNQARGTATGAILALGIAMIASGGCRSPESAESRQTLSLPNADETTPSSEPKPDVVKEKPLPAGAYHMVGKPVPGAAKGLIGDLNGDGRIDAQDVRIGMDLAVGKKPPTPAQLKAADLNHDGRISISEVTAIRRHVQESRTP